jgi:hypothetical protein
MRCNRIAGNRRQRCLQSREAEIRTEVTSHREDHTMELARRYALAAAAACLLTAWSVPSSAQTIIDQWSSIKAPAAPELKSVTIEPGTTALLMLDFVKQTCNEKVRPRCLATLPAAKQLLTEARAKKVPVVYSFVAGGTMADTLADVAPNSGEPAVRTGR